MSDTAKTIKAGRARSRREISAYLSGIKCPTCGGPMRSKWDEVTDQGATVRMYSKKCDGDFDYVFEPGPGWKQRPRGDEPSYGATDDPSTIVPETKFRELVDFHVTHLRGLEAEPPPKKASDAERTQHAGMMEADALEALAALLELGKFARAAKRMLDPELAKLEPWLRKHLSSQGK